MCAMTPNPHPGAEADHSRDHFIRPTGQLAILRRTLRACPLLILIAIIPATTLLNRPIHATPIIAATMISNLR